MSCRFVSFLLIVLVSLAAGRPAVATEPNTLTPEELADGWILLFDGESTFGWTAASKANWRVADGVLSVADGEPGLLRTTTQFGDYALKIDFRSRPGTNSGVFLRTSPKPTDPTADCYELNIADAETSPFPTGSLVARAKAATSGETNDWQTFEITAEGGHFEVRLDGRNVLDYTDEKPLGRGFIGLQFNQGPIEFRSIKLKPLAMKSIFSGKDLAGWNTDQARQSVFRVTPDGAMRMTGGPGQIESDGKYGDFTLQLDIFSGGNELNSGVFFRSIPGEFWMGYESQIHNGMHDGDPKRPNNCGTGGIFRRQDARRIMAKDFEWFHKTIVADGNHMAVWVNGVQVTDWTDRRPPNENPRQGLRRKPGTIILQGHDPTTDLSFRNIGIAELPPRRK